VAGVDWARWLTRRRVACSRMLSASRSMLMPVTASRKASARTLVVTRLSCAGGGKGVGGGGGDGGGGVGPDTVEGEGVGVGLRMEGGADRVGKAVISLLLRRFFQKWTCYVSLPGSVESLRAHVWKAR
jgi:L-asparaginase II